MCRWGLAYYSATFNFDYSFEQTGLPNETESWKLTGGKLGYHGFLEGEFLLAERVRDILDFNGISYSACILFLI